MSGAAGPLVTWPQDITVQGLDDMAHGTVTCHWFWDGLPDVMECHMSIKEVWRQIVLPYVNIYTYQALGARPGRAS